ncbi:hypothetical protein [Micromonospora sp. NPDC047527]|uniref:hypothetical protein n=1 Tax=Micromonospora sp. NPDC047527 TaxID=3155144 RepID=UPI0033C68685
MTKYGFSLLAFNVHRHGATAEPLGAFDGGTGDALPILYGILRGLQTEGVSSKDRHLKVKRVTPFGRTVRFAVRVGNSGQSSEFYDRDDEDTIVFTRNGRHIEHTTLRGVLVAPGNSVTGLLAMEVHGRVGAKTLLAPELSRRFRAFSDNHVLSIDAVADEDGLVKLLEEAQARQITLRRRGLTSDVANAVELSAEDAEAGRLELRITPGKVKQFQQRLIAKLRGEDDSTRQRLLHMGGIDFDELSVALTVGDRNTTLTVTADRVPSFVYDLARGNTPPDDDSFYREVLKTINDVVTTVGVTVGAGWDTGTWSEEALKIHLTVPQEELTHATEGKQ